MTKVLAVIGAGRGSGKTSLIESVIKELTARGYKIGAIKQIHSSIDTPHKDTWRIAKAGAKIVVAAAQREIAAIKRVKRGERFAEAMRLLENEPLDLVIVEGNPPADVPKIFVAQTREEARKFLPTLDSEASAQDARSCLRKDVLCIASFSPEKIKLDLPVFSLKDAKKIADMIEARILK